MQSVIDAFSVEEVDSVRRIAQSVQVAWKKDFRSSIKFFTIGVSTIGGNDLIPGPAGVPSAWNKYIYNDESSRVLSIDYDRELNMPLGGLVKAMADVRLDNTSGRYTPRYAGGTSELFTAILPRRPLNINAGLQVSGADMTLPQFIGVTDKAVEIDSRSKTAGLHAVDFIDYLQNRYLDTQIMFTSQTIDTVMGRVLSGMGLSTAQYELDPGINIIPFGLFDVGTRFSDMFDQLVKSEYGHMYQDEEGVIRFENRQHWSSYPHFNVQRVINTSQVINSVLPDTDHLVNVVEVRGSARNKQPLQPLINFTIPTTISPSSDLEQFYQFDDPVLQITNPTAGGADSYYLANTSSDGTGTDVTSSVSIASVSTFAKAVKVTFRNNSTSTVFLTKVVISGRPARVTSEIYARVKDDSSVTAFEERSVVIENDYIQNQFWANSLGQLIVNDFSNPENLTTLTIRAIPELQMGDLISWQGRPWRVYGIKTNIDPGVGFIQELKLLQRTIATYFRIGISTIGGSDKIAP